MEENGSDVEVQDWKVEDWKVEDWKVEDWKAQGAKVRAGLPDYSSGFCRMITLVPTGTRS
jgi:hypothetical protein